MAACGVYNYMNCHSSRVKIQIRFSHMYLAVIGVWSLMCGMAMSVLAVSSLYLVISYYRVSLVVNWL